MVTHSALSIAALKAGRIEAGADALEKIPYAWENRRLLQEVNDLFPELGQWTIPLAMVDPSREQAGQVKALECLKNEYRFYGLKIQATIIQSPILDLAGAGRCLLEFAERENLPVLIHTSIHPEDPWSQVADILTVVRAWPGVRFCLAHSCRFDRDGLDEVARLPNAWFDCSAHVIHCRLAAQDHPAVAVRERRFESDYHDPVNVLAELANAYPDKLMWGSDAPFYSYVSPDPGEGLKLTCSYEEEARPLLALPEAVQERISFHNTMAFLGLDALPDAGNEAESGSAGEGNAVS
ncbi:hypothetical protein OPIT5_23850 [Opitutaceae bacterium TAV5]|nr:hypothetical protein OPIT5_23850 [Opitutaceae bacterium TAV5]